MSFFSQFMSLVSLKSMCVGQLELNLHHFGVSGDRCNAKTENLRVVEVEVGFFLPLVPLSLFFFHRKICKMTDILKKSEAEVIGNAMKNNVSIRESNSYLPSFW